MDISKNFKFLKIFIGYNICTLILSVLVILNKTDFYFFCKYLSCLHIKTLLKIEANKSYLNRSVVRSGMTFIF